MVRHSSFAFRMYCFSARAPSLMEKMPRIGLKGKSFKGDADQRTSVIVTFLPFFALRSFIIQWFEVRWKALIFARRTEGQTTESDAFEPS